MFTEKFLPAPQVKRRRKDVDGRRGDQAHNEITIIKGKAQLIRLKHNRRLLHGPLPLWLSHFNFWSCLCSVLTFSQTGDNILTYRMWAMIWEISNPTMIRPSTAQFAMYLSHCADTSAVSNTTIATTSTLSLYRPCCWTRSTRVHYSVGRQSQDIIVPRGESDISARLDISVNECNKICEWCGTRGHYFFWCSTIH